MLINLSNHPSALWSEIQLAAAGAAFGAVIDLPFPHIPPEIGPEQVMAMALDFFRKIEELPGSPTAVHIMGELTFTYALVGMLKQVNYTVVASTTHREVTLHPDGSKTSAFQFVRFRSY